MQKSKQDSKEKEQYLQHMISELADKKLVTIATELDNRITTLENAPHNAKLATMVSLLLDKIGKFEIRMELMENRINNNKMI
jgi:type VI protein secretion system component VasF